MILVTLPKTAVMVVVTGPTEVARPLLLFIVATVGAEEVQVGFPLETIGPASTRMGCKTIVSLEISEKLYSLFLSLAREGQTGLAGYITRKFRLRCVGPHVQEANHEFPHYHSRNFRCILEM